jgi:hypothetical protein
MWLSVKVCCLADSCESDRLVGVDHADVKCPGGSRAQTPCGDQVAHTRA